MFSLLLPLEQQANSRKQADELTEKAKSLHARGAIFVKCTAEGGDFDGREIDRRGKCEEAR